jgi:SOS-response transcriptional repressor LexA
MSHAATLPDPGPEVRAHTRGDAIIEAIVTLTARDGRPPSYKEIMAAVGLRSRRLFHREIDRLVDYGRLRRLPGARGLIVPPGGSAPTAA